MKYLAASIVIAAAAAVYGLFSHGVYSYFMTYAFMIPLLGGALPHLTAAMKRADTAAAESMDENSGADAEKIADENSGDDAEKIADENSADEAEKPAESAQTVRTGFAKIFDAKEAQLAVIATLTAGSLLKGVLDIYGTTNRLLIAYPAIAALMLVIAIASTVKTRGSAPEFVKNR